MPSELVEHLEDVWLKSTTYIYAPWFTCAPEFEHLLVREMSQLPIRFDEVETLVRRHKEPHVCAHALRAISEVPGPRTAALLNEFSSDKRVLEIRIGSFVYNQELGTVAKLLAASTKKTCA
jgi:hypothetical protein